MNSVSNNVDELELRKFDELASRWWDPEGEFRPLHRLNPLRTGYIKDRVKLTGARCLDVGCGGGILTEALAAAGAEVTGIDMAPQPLAVARLHLLKSGAGSIRYLQASAESLLPEAAGSYDVVTCMEVLEHVPDPAALVASCAQLVRPGGDVFFATINRNPKAFALAIIGAEYLLRLLPRGTHTYAKFIRPSELRRWSQAAGLCFEAAAGMHYNPLDGSARPSSNPDINYLMHLRRPA